MNKETEVLTAKERFINVLYYIFRYILYAIAWGFLANKINNDLLYVFLLVAFVYFSYMVYENKIKIIESIIAEERHNIIQVFTNPDYGKANSPDIDEIRKSMDMQDFKSEILNMIENENATKKQEKTNE